MSKAAEKKRIVEPSLGEEPPPPPAADGWDGTYSGLRLSRPVLRDHILVGPGKPCPVCGAETHNMEIAAALVDGVWLGPEAGHVQDLIAVGVVAGTPESAQRTARQAEVDYIRGTNGTPDHPEGWPSLRERTLMDMERSQLGRDVAGGPAAVIAMENDLRAGDAAELRRLREGLGARDDRLLEVLERLAPRAEVQDA